MIQARRLGHATLSTPELDRAIEYYNEVLGLNVVARDKNSAILATKTGIEAIALEKSDHAELKRLSFQVLPNTDLKNCVKTLLACPLHKILTNAGYATGKWPFGKLNSRTGQLHDPSLVVDVPVPPIIPMELFERVQARLANNNPRVTPPRFVNGPILLSGLATCATCGASMTRTGTTRRHKSYTYYSCSGCQRKGKSVCKGRHVPMPKLDELVLQNIKEQLLVPERLTGNLEALMERRSEKDQAVADRRKSLEGELSEKKDKLARLYRAIEEGVIDLDADLKDRIQTLKNERDIVQATMDRIDTQAHQSSSVTPERIEAFSKLMRDKLDSGDTQARKAYLRSVISKIEVDDQKVRIFGEKSALAEVIAGRQAQAGNVRGFVREWRDLGESNPSLLRERQPS